MIISHNRNCIQLQMKMISRWSERLYGTKEVYSYSCVMQVQKGGGRGDVLIQLFAFLVQWKTKNNRRRKKTFKCNGNLMQMVFLFRIKTHFPYTKSFSRLNRTLHLNEFHFLTLPFMQHIRLAS